MGKKIKSIKIKQLREEKGWTQAYLATAAGVERSTIIRMEKGKKKFFSLETIKSVASAFDLDFTNLLEHEFLDSTMDLKKLEHGKNLDDLSFGKNGTDFDYDDSIKNPYLLEIIYTFFDFLESHIDNQLKWNQRMSASEVIAINNFLNKLGENDLFIYGGEIVIKLDGEDNFIEYNCIKIWVGYKIEKLITKDDLTKPFSGVIGLN
jgi:transcriptional regulator with XRE-family HTH domain